MTERDIHFCTDLWPSGPVWDAFLDAFEAWVRADERRIIEAEEAERWQPMRELIHTIATQPSYAELQRRRQESYVRAEAMWAEERARTTPWPDDQNPWMARRAVPVSLEKRAAA